ncbi:MAG: ABC transporter ATP-binding protein [Myxococcales bacterium]|nr:ABC transporter ATP-binding protein [Myxococcales bacterium]
MLELRKLQRCFGEFTLGPISLSLPVRRYLVVLGPSGSGKSLLLSALAGVFRAEPGHLLLDGHDVGGLPPERRNCALVFQDPWLLPHLDVSRNVAFGLSLRAIPKGEREARVRELLELLGITRLAKARPARLSGGEAQRVALARALAVRPRLLLLDEPLSRLDHNSRLELRAELRRLHQTLSLTTVHVTHDREEARSVGDDVAIMLGGRVVQSGPLSLVMERPACPFVARFLGLSWREGGALPGCSQKCMEGSGLCDRMEPTGEGD